MEQAYFRFYAELNDFLPLHRRQVNFAHRLKERGSIKDVIEALGVPHTEVDLILVNDESVDFSYLVQDGDRISVYPLFRSIDISSLTYVRPQPLSQARFVLDIHLGKLAAYLRLLGFDTLYRNDYQDQELARISSREKRILLTKDRPLLKRSIVIYGYCVRESDPWLQVVEVLQRFNLFGAMPTAGVAYAPLQRCLHCNGLTEPVSKEIVSSQIPSLTRQYYDEFSVCQACGKIYWKGAHYERIQQFIDRVLQHKSNLQAAGKRSLE